MLKKILIVSISALCCLLIGLLVVFFYFNSSVNKKNSILSFIPAKTQVLVRIKQTSVTTNNFFTSPLVQNCFAMGEVSEIWKSIDSVTSRNYKTAEVLLKNTSYICLDSSFNYLILVDLDKKTNEHFIDQFLVNSTNLRKIQRFRQGYKAFFPQTDKPLFYFVKHGVFAVSSSEDFVLSSLQHGESEKIEEQISVWDHETDSDLALWALNGAEEKLIGDFGVYQFIQYYPSIKSTSMQLNVNIEKLVISGSHTFDSTNYYLSGFQVQSQDAGVYFYSTDTGVFENYFYGVQIKDSTNTLQPVSFVFSNFVDSGSVPSSLLVSQSPLIISVFQSVSGDSLVQIIPMADENIKQIAVFDWDFCSRILPVVPFEKDSNKLFATVYNDYLFIARSTETILKYSSNYPGSNFIKKKLASDVVMVKSGIRKFSNPYQVESTYRLSGKNTISFTSELKLINPNK